MKVEIDYEKPKFFGRSIDELKSYDKNMYPIKELISLTKSAYCHIHDVFDTDWTKALSGQVPTNLEKKIDLTTESGFIFKFFEICRLIEEEKLKSDYIMSPRMIWEIVDTLLSMYPDRSSLLKTSWKQFESHPDVIFFFMITIFNSTKTI